MNRNGLRQRILMQAENVGTSLRRSLDQLDQRVAEARTELRERPAAAPAEDAPERRAG